MTDIEAAPESLEIDRIERTVEGRTYMTDAGLALVVGNLSFPDFRVLIAAARAEAALRTVVRDLTAERDAAVAAKEAAEREVHLLDEVCTFYADDEDRYLIRQGEAYCIPTEVGMKARSARQRHRAREAALQPGAPS